MNIVVLVFGLGVLAGLSLQAGRHWAQSTTQAGLWGMLAAVAGVTAGLALAVIVALFDYAMVDLPAIRSKLAVLLAGGAVMGAVLALGARRRAMRADLTTPPEVIARRLRRI